MDIEIGRAPDYVMRRGQEILNHRMKLVIHRLGQKIFDEIYTSRSLAMVLREGKNTLERQSVFYKDTEISFKIDAGNQSSRVIFNIIGRKAEALLYLPSQLTDRQAFDIAQVHTDYFKK